MSDQSRTRREWQLAVRGDHPAATGPIAFALTVDESAGGETITQAEPLVYPLHRGAEKLFESRDYRQILMMADRHDWHSAFGSELGLALTLEASLGIVVPPRATWIRTLMAELNRAIHHLRWLGETAFELQLESAELAAGARAARERLIDVQESISGGRLHPMLVQPGGLRADAPPGWAASATAAASAAQASAGALTEWADSAAQLGRVAVLPREEAVRFAVSGPVARASGLALDLRFDEPYCAYAELAEAGVLTRATADAGDAQARFQVIAAELETSLLSIRYCAAKLDEPGEVSVRLPRSFRVPEGDSYGWTENPTGINGWYVVSRGGTEPYRLKLRTASFANAQALSAILPGTDVTDLPAALMSFFLVAGDLAK